MSGDTYLAHLGDSFKVEKYSPDQMLPGSGTPMGSSKWSGCLTAQGASLLSFTHPTSNLPVGSSSLSWMPGSKRVKFPASTTSMGMKILTRLGSQNGNVGFYLPAMAKGDLFKTVILDGALPRKTFSMGEAIEKRLP